MNDPIQTQIYVLNSNLAVLTEQIKNITQDMKERLKEVCEDTEKIKLFIGRADTELAIVNKTLEHYRERETDSWNEVTGKQKSFIDILKEYDTRIKDLENTKREAKWPVKVLTWGIIAIVSFICGIIGSRIASLF
jgi:chromosome segregation ATPase